MRIENFIIHILSAVFCNRQRHESFARDLLAGVEPAVIGLIVAAAVAIGPGSISLAHPVNILLDFFP